MKLFLASKFVIRITGNSPYPGSRYCVLLYVSIQKMSVHPNGHLDIMGYEIKYVVGK